MSLTRIPSWRLPASAQPGDDEIAAVELQLEELNIREEAREDRYSVFQAPDSEVALADYLDEIKCHLNLLKDAKLAHSIASAVTSDAEAISELVQAETQAQDDRQVALEICNQDSDCEDAPPPPPYTPVASSLVGADFERYALHTDTEDDEEPVAGPSEPYVRRQAKAIEKLADHDFKCVACDEGFRFVDITQLDCEDQYCHDCLKRFIMRGVVERDLALLPPRCCGEDVSDKVIAKTLAPGELQQLQDAQIEKDTRDKTYCSNADCGKFIPPRNVVNDRATCAHCRACTCHMCKNAFHNNEDCPADMALQETLDLGQELQWKRCFSCRAMVSIETGCNHMTCRCGAEFCYLCGEEWTIPRSCTCNFWIEENLIRRATQVVDREAVQHIAPAIRLRRIAQVQAELRDTDECDHRGKRKFERIEGGRNTRFECEMCSARHRQFILRCRRCRLDVCVDCRLHRV